MVELFTTSFELSGILGASVTIILFGLLFIIVTAVFVMLLRYAKIYNVPVMIIEKRGNSERWRKARGRLEITKTKETKFSLYRLFGGLEIPAPDPNQDFIGDSVVLYKFGATDYVPVHLRVNSPAFFEAVQSSDKEFYIRSLKRAFDRTVKPNMLAMYAGPLMFFGVVILTFVLVLFVMNDFKTVLPSIADSLRQAAVEMKQTAIALSGTQQVAGAPPG